MAPEPVKVATSVDDGDKYRDQSASSWNKEGHWNKIMEMRVRNRSGNVWKVLDVTSVN
jgi:hypothetical protein